MLKEMTSVIMLCYVNCTEVQVTLDRRVRGGDFEYEDIQFASRSFTLRSVDSAIIRKEKMLSQTTLNQLIWTTNSQLL